MLNLQSCPFIKYQRCHTSKFSLLRARVGSFCWQEEEEEMANNQGRLFSAIIKLSASRLGLSFSRSEPVSLSAKCSARRLICSSTELQRPEEPKDSDKRQEGEPVIKKEIKNEGEEDEEDGVYVNKETGEIGGPRGPEPTRYGDWEQKGRCSDF
ncbi:hypothetical protein NMG60_11018014 [Bertholletia excelsa]